MLSSKTILIATANSGKAFKKAIEILDKYLGSEK